jgi:hypothetical protein
VLDPVAFSEDNEWRWLAQKVAGDTEAVKFREVQGLLIPYMCAPVASDGIAVKTIVCKPTLHPDLSRRSVEMIAQKCGLTGVTVVNSIIPLSSF